MLTLFTVPKPFRDHIAVIQRNTIQSWLRLEPACQVILFGNEVGVAEVAAEFGLMHIPQVLCNPFRTPLLDGIFRTAQQRARHDLLCYINADIILLGDFVAAVRRMPPTPFLMAGQRWNVELRKPLDFSAADWEARLRENIKRTGVRGGAAYIDYFVFRRGNWQDLPPFAVGRPRWDNWMIWRARSLGFPVIDATEMVTAIHQDHDYRHVPQGINGTWNGPEANANLLLAGGLAHVFTLKDANRILTTDGLCRPRWTINRFHRFLDTVPVLYPSYAGVARVARRLAGPRALARDLLQRVRKAVTGVP